MSQPSVPPDNNKFVSVKDAAKKVGYTPDYVVRIVRENKVKSKTVGNEQLVNVDSLKTFELESRAKQERREERLSRERYHERVIAEGKANGLAQIEPTYPKSFGSLIRSTVVFAAMCALLAPAFFIQHNGVSAERMAHVAQHSLQRASALYAMQEESGSYGGGQSAALLGAVGSAFCDYFDGAFVERWLGVCIEESHVAFDAADDPVAPTAAAPSAPAWPIAEPPPVLVREEAIPRDDTSRDDLAAATHQTNFAYVAEERYLAHVGQVTGALRALNPLLAALAPNTALIERIRDDIDDLEGEMDDIDDRSERQDDKNRDEIGDRIDELDENASFSGTFTLEDITGGVLVSDGAGRVSTTTLSGANITDDALDFAQFSDTMTVDATTAFDLDANNADLNFDAGTLMIDADASRVGIGILSPEALFHVAGDAIIAGAAQLASTTITGGATIDSIAAGSITSSGTVTAASFVATGSGATSTFSSLETIGDATIGGSLIVAGNSTVFGTTTTGTLAINSRINSDLVPDVNAMYDLGSAARFWGSAYIDTLTVNSISAASTTIAGTQSQTFTLNSDNATADTENVELIFYRGTVVPNALITWDAAADRFDINQPFFIENDSSDTSLATLELRAAAGQTGDLFRAATSSGGTAFAIGADGAVTDGVWNGSEIDIGDYTNFTVTATGLALSNDTLALSAGYEIPLSASTTEWSTAYSWGDHALAGYLTTVAPADLAAADFGDFTCDGTACAVDADALGSDEIADIYLLNTGDTATGDYNFDSNTLVVDAANDRIGIGTADPASPLHIVHDTNLTTVRLQNTNASYSSGFGFRDAAGANRAYLEWANSSSGSPFGADSLTLFTLQSDPIVFATFNDEKMRITDAGHVGIGTSTPSSLLHVYGAEANALVLERSTGDTSSVRFKNAEGEVYAGLSHEENFAIGPNLDLTSSPYLTILASNGNVGVGTSTPSSKLHISGNGHLGGIYLDGGDTGAAVPIKIHTDGDHDWAVHSIYSNDEYSDALVLQGQWNGATDRNILLNPDGAASVGIGTTDPSYSLTISGNGGTDEAFVNATGGVAYFGSVGNKPLSLETNGTTRLHITSSGNVGVGTTTPLSGSLTLTDRMLFTNNIANNAAVLITAGTGSFGSIQATNAANSAVTNLTLQQYGGNVGIGDTSPGTRLAVSGNSSSETVVDIQDPSGFSRVRLELSAGAGVFEASNASGAQKLLLAASGDSYLNGGNVGIGTTAPEAKLDIVSTEVYTSGWAKALKLSNTSNLIENGSAAIGLNGDGGLYFMNDTLGDYTGGSWWSSVAMGILANGNVGIGVANPGKKLTVAGSMEVGTGHADYQHLRIGGGNSSGYLYGAFSTLADGIHLGYNYYNDNSTGIIPNTGGGTSRITTSFGYIALATGGVNTAPTERVRVDANGNVGINDSTPNYTLDVAGTGRFTGTLTTTDLVSVTYELGRVDGISTTPYIDFHTGNALDFNARIISIGNSSTAAGGAQLQFHSGSNYFSSPVGIGRGPATNRLEVEGAASKSTAGDWLANSDRRIKDHILDAGGLEFIRKLRPVTFEYTDEYLAQHPDIEDRTYYNFIAQEFAEVFPDAVKGSGEYLPNGEEILQLDTHNAFIASIAAIKELDLTLSDLATTTPFGELENDSFTKKFFGAFIAWFADAANGIGEMVANTFRASEELCINDTCINEAELIELLGEGGANTDDANNDDNTDDDGDTDDDADDGTDGGQAGGDGQASGGANAGGVPADDGTGANDGGATGDGISDGSDGDEMDGQTGEGDVDGDPATDGGQSDDDADADDDGSGDNAGEGEGDGTAAGNDGGGDSNGTAGDGSNDGADAGNDPSAGSAQANGASGDGGATSGHDGGAGGTGSEAGSEL